MMDDDSHVGCAQCDRMKDVAGAEYRSGPGKCDRLARKRGPLACDGASNPSSVATYCSRAPGSLAARQHDADVAAREIVEMAYAEWIAGRHHQGKPPVSRKHARLGIDDQGLMQHFQRCRAGHDDVRVGIRLPG